MTSTSIFFPMCRHFFGFSGPTQTVFGLTLNLTIIEGEYQNLQTNARNFDMAIAVKRRDISQKFMLFVTFHYAFFNRSLSAMVLMLNNDLTNNKQLVYSYKKCLYYNHARSGQIFNPIRSQQKKFCPRNPTFVMLKIDFSGFEQH